MASVLAARERHSLAMTTKPRSAGGLTSRCSRRARAALRVNTGLLARALAAERGRYTAAGVFRLRCAGELPEPTVVQM